MARQTSANLAQASDPFAISDEIRDVARQVIADNNAFRQLDEIEIQYLLNNKAADEDLADGIDGIVRAVKAPPIWRFLADVEVVVWVVAAYWRVFDSDARRAAVTHALSHVQLTEDDKGEIRIKIVGHDVEEFHRVAMQFGPWTSSVALFAKAIAAQRDGVQATQQALDTALDQLDGTTIVDPESGTTATISRGPKAPAAPEEVESLASEAVAAGEISPEEADAVEAANDGACGVAILDDVRCGLPAFHPGAHEGSASNGAVADGAAPAAPKRPRKSRS